MTTLPNWPYGTEPKPDAPAIVWVEREFLEAMLGDWLDVLSPVLPGVGIFPIDVGQLCSQQPDPAWELNALELLTLTRGWQNWPTLISRMRDAAKWNAWPQVCRYRAAPDPVAEPAPPPPSTTPPAVPPTATPAPPLPDLIGNEQLYSQLMALNAGQSRLLWLVNWIVSNMQVRNTAYGGRLWCSGTGSQYTWGAVGYIIRVLNYPAFHATSPGTPPTIFDLGYVSYGLEDGFRSSVRVTRPEHFLWCDGGEMDRFQWELAPNVDLEVDWLVTRVVDPLPGGGE